MLYPWYWHCIKKFPLRCVHTFVLLYDVVLVQKYVYDLIYIVLVLLYDAKKFFVQTVVPSASLVSCVKIRVRGPFWWKDDNKLIWIQQARTFVRCTRVRRTKKSNTVGRRRTRTRTFVRVRRWEGHTRTKVRGKIALCTTVWTPHYFR